MSGIIAWEDDPLSSPAAEPVRRPVPVVAHARLGLSIVGKEPPARIYPTGTPGFRHWNAADSLGRAVRFWGRLLPGKARWHAGKPLIVDLDAGYDLNAYYDRQQLCFFRATVRGVTVYSGESPDVLCHELGHAVLDAVRPQLWNTASIEAAALHESFGDLGAMLSALELPSVCEGVIADTGGRLSRASRLSRLAEQLGWAVRQSHPDAVDADCLRNAANSFFYCQPEDLPPTAPASALSSEPHSFSRVFTAAWLESLAGMIDASAPGGATPDGVATAAGDAGRLLLHAIGAARITSNYFAQVAGGLIAADAQLLDGRYSGALQRAFVGRGVLSMASAAAMARPSAARPAAAARQSAGPTTIEIPVDGLAFGLRLHRLLVEAPVGALRQGAAAAAAGLGSLPPVSPTRASRAFVEDLLRRGRVDASALVPGAAGAPRPGQATHALVRDGRRVRLVRLRVHGHGGR
jgi:hypothetical protein